MVDFAKMAAVSVEDIPEVKNMPVGTYQWVVTKVPETKASSNGSSTLINFSCKCLGPIEDFENPDALEEFGSVKGILRTLMFIYPEQQKDDEDKATFERRQTRAINDLMKFLVNDLKVEDGNNVHEKMALSANYQFIGGIEHQLDNRDNKTMQERLRRTAPLPE